METAQARKRVRDLGCRYRFALILPFLASLLVALPIAQSQQIHRNGFESRAPAWTRGPADAAFKETAHDISEQTAHDGQLSEHLQLTAEQGSYIHYLYPVGKAPLGEELSVKVWLRANRPGTQLMARLILPRERDPGNLNEPMSALLRGEQYQLVGRWQMLELRRPLKLAKEQQTLMRAELKRDVDFTGAYIDKLILNVYGGPGLTELWIDDLEVGPVLEPENTGPAQQRTPVAGTPTSRPGQASPKSSLVELNQDRLLVNGKRFFFRAIRYFETPLKTLRDAGFNTIWFDAGTPAARIDEATKLGFWLVPALPIAVNDPQTQASQFLFRIMAQYPQADVLFWDLGPGRTTEEAPLLARTVQAVRIIDSSHPVGADVWDGFLPYSRHFDLVGAHRWPLLTGLELAQYRDWLNQRRLLVRPGTFLWTWVQTHLPEWYSALVADPNSAPGRDEPTGPQPEQIRLLTYVAMSAGCQGLGFWSDRMLADSQQGRDRLLTLALLNMEMQMLEPMLLAAVDPPVWVDTSIPEVKAAVIRTELGVLVLPIWLGRGSQFVPGQAAVARLSVVVPQVPVSASAWEVSPGNMRSLAPERVPGGTKITLPEFGLTAAIVFTADQSPNGLVARFQSSARKTRKQAAQWMYELALAESDKVLKVQTQLEQGGHTVPDGPALKEQASSRLETAKSHWDNGNYSEAYAESGRALRPLRILMRAQWEAAVRQLDTPVASVYATSFYTLPRHHELMALIGPESAKPGGNVLPDGDFEAAAEQKPVSWTPQEITLDDVELRAWRAAEEPREGRRCLKLEIKPKHPEQVPAALERTFLAINSPAVRLPPGAIVKISGWVRIPKPITASVDGVLFYDSAGGEPLAVRLAGRTGWKRYTLYRRVPDSGSIQVTCALTGIGTAYFDDIRIEPFGPAESGITRQPPAPRPLAATPTARPRQP